MAREVVILGTGGTIAGTAADAQDHVDYDAAQLGVEALVDAVPALRGLPLRAEQVAQVDSSNMTHAVWQQLARRARAHLERPEVAGLVITHGTDTLEETAYFLHRVLAPDRPVVLTAAMRPATALQADGPQNLLDAVTLALSPDAAGVLVVVAGRVFAGATLRKRHTYRLDAFSGGDAGPIGAIEQGRLRRWGAWPSGATEATFGLEAIDAEPADWPRVEIVTSHAGSDGRIVRALMAQGVDAIVVAGVGNGHVHAELESALAVAASRGVAVAHCTRCAEGVVVGSTERCGALTPPQARVEMLLRLLAARRDDA